MHNTTSMAKRKQVSAKSHNNGPLIDRSDCCLSDIWDGTTTAHQCHMMLSIPSPASMYDYNYGYNFAIKLHKEIWYGILFHPYKVQA